VIYILSNPGYPERVLIGTASWIAEARRSIADQGVLVEVHQWLDDSAGVRNGCVTWLRHLACIGVLDGDEAEAERLRELLWETTWSPEPLYDPLYFAPLFVAADDIDRWREGDPGCTPWRVATPEFSAWLAAHARPWDGSEAERLGIKGLGRVKPKPAPKPCPPARASTIAERMARRRAKG
jgi:hypothetical protein